MVFSAAPHLCRAELKHSVIDQWCRRLRTCDHDKERQYEQLLNYPHMLIGMLGIYHLLFVCVRKIFCKGYLRCGLTQGDEIWQDGRPRWIAIHLPFGELGPGG